jgi:hypothetical protein
MTLYVDPKKIVWGEFGGLEPPQEVWRDQFPYWEDYVRKFFASNGLPFASNDSNVERWLMSEDRAPFASMVEALLPDLRARAEVKGTEVILFAHWLPDLHLGTSVTNFAMHRLGLENCFGFAISDRGLSAPFFAFDSLYRYLGTTGGKGLLVIADQKHLMYRSDLVEALNPKNAACVMALDTLAPAGLRYCGYRRLAIAGIGPGAAIAAGLADLGLDRAATVLIGPKTLLDSAPAAAGTHATDERLICSAPFVALAQSQWPNLNHLLLCRDGDWLSFLGFAGARA